MQLISVKIPPRKKMTNILKQISFGFGDYRLVARVWPIVVKKNYLSLYCTRNNATKRSVSSLISSASFAPASETENPEFLRLISEDPDFCG
jgi:hypothetical protein